MQIPFNATIIAHEEMGLYALLSSVECFMKLFVALLIGTSCIDNLEFYGISLFVVAIIVFISYISVAVWRYSECRYRKINNKLLIQ